jgi:sugar phosphate isomerase/epimerase
MTTTRRGFLAATLLAGGAALTGPGAASAIEPFTRKGNARLKLSIAGYSYREHFAGKREPAMTLEDFVDLAAEIGFDAVEPTAYYFKDTSPAYLGKLRARCTRLGLDVSAGAIGNNFCFPDAAKHKAEIALAKQWIERYSILGAKAIRFFAGTLQRGDDEAKARERCIAALQECCDHAANYGIFLALENHGGITATPDQMMHLIKGVKHEFFGVNFDSGNFRTADPYGDLAKIAPYAVNAQIKTEIHPIKSGATKPTTEEADLKRLVDILKAANYRGYVALEYEAKEDPIKAIPRHAAELRKLIG